MNRNDAIMWFARIATIIFTIAVVWDVYHGQELSRGIRATVLVVVGLLVGSIFVWQVYIAQKYDGIPIIPFSFRWVTAVWFGSLMTFIMWIVLINYFDGLYTYLRSAAIWHQFGVATLWFMSRWLTLDQPHKAGVGETGSSGNGNGGA